MSEIEKMKQYVDKTNIRESDRYQMKMTEWSALVNATQHGAEYSAGAIALAFNYGKAKGYRAAKAKVRA